MPWWIWLILSLFMLAMIVAGIAYAALHGFRALNGIAEIGSRLGKPLSELAGQIHREVGHHGLACARRGRDEHVLPPLQRVYRVLLEIVQVERQRGCETRGDARVMRLTLLECGIPLGRRWAGSIRRRMFALMFDHA